MSASTSEQGTLPVGVVVPLLVEDESEAIKDRVLCVLLLSGNIDEVSCHDSCTKKDDDCGAVSGLIYYFMLEKAPIT